MGIVRIGDGKKPHDCYDYAPLVDLIGDSVPLPDGTVWRCECGKLYVLYGTSGMLMRDATLREKFKFRNDR